MSGVLRTRTEGVVLHRAEVFTQLEYHFLVNRDGTVKEMVPVAMKGAHAVTYNANTVSIAVFGDFASAEPGVNQFPTYQQVITVIDLCRQLNKMYGGKLWCAGHSQLGTKGTTVPAKLTLGHTCPGEYFPLAEVILRSGLRPFPLN